MVKQSSLTYTTNVLFLKGKKKKTCGNAAAENN